MKTSLAQLPLAYRRGRSNSRQPPRTGFSGPGGQDVDPIGK